MKAFLPLLAVLFVSGAHAELALAPVFGDNMVLQRNAPLPVWGKADAGENITVRFAGQTKTAKADTAGNWRIILDPLPASAGARTLVITAGNNRHLTNILVGDVWLCSGQSNMRFMLKESVGGTAEAATASDPQLRLFDLVSTVPGPRAAFTDKQIALLMTNRFFRGSWRPCSSNSASGFSAVGYLFGKRIRAAENVPVGLICNAIGGSPMAAWLPAETLAARPEYASLTGENWLHSPRMQDWVLNCARENLGTNTNVNHPFKPSFLFESGVRPLAPMPLAGCLWYQGESDAQVLETDFNEMMLTDLIKSWRRVVGRKDMPFVMVQLPRINDTAELRQGWPQFREVQANVAATMSNVFACVTIDLGTTNANVHPPDKRPVAERLANLVRQNIYGAILAAGSPALEHWAVKSNILTVWFSNGKGLATTDGAAPKEFQIAGSDGKYFAAKAAIRADGGVELKSPEVAAPMAARYCWAVFVTPNLTNAAGLPVAPFRTEKLVNGDGLPSRHLN